MLKGIYLLYIRLKESQGIVIGSLGHIEFKKGFYIYIGSAKNGITRRVSRHLNNNKKIYWHIDYLLNNDLTDIRSVYYIEGNSYSECDISSIFLDFLGQCSYPVKKFGCSDCRCISHLYYFSRPFDFESFPVKLKILL